MAATSTSRLAPPAFQLDGKQHRRLIAQWEREAHQGHLGNVGNVTLAINVATTSVTDNRVGPNSFIGLTPSTANAAGAVGSTYISARIKGGFTITHANTATADRAFVYCILG